MISSPSQSDLENQPENVSIIKQQVKPFRLRDAVKDMLHYHMMTTLPRSTYVHKLWKLAESIGNDITLCLNMLYCQVTQRNGNGEGRPHYFYHVGATSLYETHYKKLIKGKNHTLKSGDVFMKIVKTLKEIDKALAKVEEAKENIRLLKYFKSELSVHHNLLLFSMRNAPEKTRKHLVEFKSLDVATINDIELSTIDLKRVAKTHPEKVKVIDTPKKPTKAVIRTRIALQATEPADVPNKPAKEDAGIVKKLIF